MMKRISETFQHEGTGIKFDVDFEPNLLNLNDVNVFNNKVRIIPTTNGYDNKGFVFNRSNPDRIIIVAKALLEIGEFCEKL